MNMPRLPTPEQAPWFRQTDSAATLTVIEKDVQGPNVFFYTTNLMHIQWNLLPMISQKLIYPYRYRHILVELFLYS